MMPEITEWLPSFTALVAVIVGPAVTLRVTRSQIRATTVSLNRQNWIHDLRDEIAEFLTDLYRLGTFGTTLRAAMAGREDTRALLETNRSLQLHRSRIGLMINPQEDKHLRLMRLLDDALSLVTMERESESGSSRPTPLAPDDSAVAHYQSEIQSLSQQILKEEWNRVKEGD